MQAEQHISKVRQLLEYEEKSNHMPCLKTLKFANELLAEAIQLYEKELQEIETRSIEF